MEMAQISVGKVDALYKGSNIGEKVKSSEGNNTKINKDKFSKELKNYSESTEKGKAESKAATSNNEVEVNSNNQVKTKDSSKDYKVNTGEVELGEEPNKDSEDMVSLIDLIIALLNKEDTTNTELNSSDIMSKDEVKGEVEPLLKLLGSEKKANNLLELLNELSLDSNVKNKVTELFTLMNEDFTQLKDNSEILMKLLTSEEGVKPDDLVSQLQKIVSMKEVNKEEIPLNIPRRIVMETEVIDKTSVVAVAKDEKESSSTDSKFSKETDILNKVIHGDEKESKVTRAVDFMSLLNNRVMEVGEVSSEKPIAITKSDFNNDVIKALSYMDKNGVKDLTVKIYPKELGEITISVSMEQGALKAMVKATSKETVEMLALGLKDINEKLNGNNIKIESVNIGLYEEDTTYFTHENNQGKAYENGGQGSSGNNRQGSEENIGEDDVISEVNNKASNEIDLLV